MDLQTSEKPVILVTGISGLIGSRIIDAFSANYGIVGLDVKPVETQTAEVERKISSLSPGTPLKSHP
jgi:nucleoside-diphosphate-sugar epimerase